MKKIVKSLVSLSCIGLVGLALVGCKGENITTTAPTTDSTPTTSVPGTSTTIIPSTTVDADTKTYKVKAECINGKPIANAEIVIKGKGVTETQYTDSKGYATFQLKDQTYTIYPEDLPGYTLQSEYSGGFLYDTSAEETVVKYDPSLIMEAKPENVTYVQGDVMYDKTFSGIDFNNGVATDGASATLSDLLKDNDLVVLNFWYSTCSWCIKEFPYLLDAYNSYKDKGVSLIGINTSDSASVLEEYGLELGLNFLNTYGDSELISAFQISSTPTTIILDPPAFSKNKESLKKAYKGYKEINMQAMKIIKSGGYLLTFSCSQHMTPSLFMQMINEAAHDAKRTVQFLDFRIQAPDHPALLQSEEQLYLKCMILRVK